MAWPLWWTWVWLNSRSWWWTGKPGMLQSMGSQRVGHDWVTELNWRKTFLKLHLLWKHKKVGEKNLKIWQAREEVRHLSGGYSKPLYVINTGQVVLFSVSGTVGTESLQLGCVALRGLRTRAATIWLHETLQSHFLKSASHCSLSFSYRMLFFKKLQIY